MVLVAISNCSMHGYGAFKILTRFLKIHTLIDCVTLHNFTAQLLLFIKTALTSRNSAVCGAEVFTAVAALPGFDAVYSGRSLLPFSGNCYCDLQVRRDPGLKIETAGSAKTSASFHHSTQCRTPEESSSTSLLCVLPEQCTYVFLPEIAIVILKRVERMVYVIDMQCVFCKVRHEF